MSQETYVKAPRISSVLELSSRNRNRNVRFSERYHLGMTANTSEENFDPLAHGVRRLTGPCENGIIDVDGVLIYSIWNPEYFNHDGVQNILVQLFREQSPISTRLRFNFHEYRKQQQLERSREEAHRRYHINAWFETQFGLFWTWEKINLSDLTINLKASLDWMNLSAEERRELSLQHRGRPTLASKLGPLMDQLNVSGKKENR